MRIKLLIASTDSDYAGHLSNRISELHGEVIDISICSSQERLQELLSNRKFEAALLEEALTKGVDLSGVKLPLLLWTEDEGADDTQDGIKRIRKYQRVSSIVEAILEMYAKVSSDGRGSDPEKAKITAVWSPCGGVGKTSVALAYAAKKASEGKQVLYLDLELFSSVPVYFNETGKSISSIFEMLENHEGNVRMLIRGIKRYDSETGIAYFYRPDNYDDMNILSTENIAELISACAGVVEELVIDMSCSCDERAQQVFDCADRVFVVSDATYASQTKLLQFATQHSVYERIKDKTLLVANKGAIISNTLKGVVISLPIVQSSDASAVYKALSGCGFEM